MEKPKENLSLVSISLIALLLMHSVIAGQSTQFQRIDSDAFGVEHLIAHWSLNESDYDGNYLDSVGGYIIRPTGEPNFINGAGNDPNGAVMITPSTGWGLSESFEADLNSGFTICIWINWNGDWHEQVGISNLALESKDSEFMASDGIQADQCWQHICIAYENSIVRVYLNGELCLSEMLELPAGNEVALEIGNTMGQQIFNGAVDDIRLYDYALSQPEINLLIAGNAD